jgi:hypothetical protein
MIIDMRRQVYNEQRIPVFYSRSEAGARSSELPSGVTAFWKGSLRWLSLDKLHLTLPHFWPKLAWDEQSSN